jgi:hypothetical protein
MDRFGTTLLIRHTDRVHREVVRILDVLERSAAAAPVFEAISIDRRLEAPILSALAVRVSVDFDSTPVLDALHDLWQQAGVEIGLASSVDGAALELDPERESVSLKRTSVPLGEVLSQIADERRWSIRVERDRLVLIPRQERDEDLWSAIYDLRDFLPQDRPLVINTLLNQTDGPWLDIDGVGGTAQLLENGLLIVRQTLANHGAVAVWLDKLRRQGLQHEPAAADTADEEWSTRIYPIENADAVPWLVEAVETFVRPETWDKAGGKGAIRGAGHSLIIRQTGAGHRDVAQLLLRIEQAHRYVSEHRPHPPANTADDDKTEPSRQNPPPPGKVAP